MYLLFSQEEMTNALATMRVDYDQVNIKNLDESDNAILRKRRKKSGGHAAQPPVPVPSTIEEQMETK